MKASPAIQMVPEPFHLLEITIISAQDLHPANRSMSTYAVAWVQPDRKLCTRVESGSHTNPQWNDKFIFRVEEWFLRSEMSAVMVEIYCAGWLRDSLIGSVRVLIGNLLPAKGAGIFAGMRFTALQVRRPSGRPQGILNLGIAVLDVSLRSVPLQLNPAIGYRHLTGENCLQLRRTKSVSEVGSVVKGKAESVADTVEEPEMMAVDKASSADGASLAGVAEEFFPAEVGSSVLEDWSVASSGGREELRLKLERWRNEFPTEFDQADGGFETPFERQPSGRRTAIVLEEEGDGPACVCSVSCGLNPRKKKKKNSGSGTVRLSPSALSFE
ncbi:unnamed protein product [Victoria cruziana]